MANPIEGVNEENQEETPQQIDPQVIERAKMQGWSPKEEFRGDPANWRPADEFVKRADEMMPIMKATNKKLEGNVASLTKELSETKGMVNKMVKIQGKYSDDLHETRVADIRTKKRVAAKDENWEEYDRLEAQEIKIVKPEPIKADPPSNENPMETVHPDVQKWIGENSSWFGNDKQMTDYAMFVGEQLKNEKDPLAAPGNESAFCDEIKKRVQGTFPGKFQNQSQQFSDVDESDLRGGDRDTSTGKQTWNDIPKNAQQQCAKMIAEIPGFTKEKYITDYFEGE